MELIPLIQKINGIQKDISENQTLISTVLPLFQYLKWNVFDEEKVIYEDTTSTKKRVDITYIFSNGMKFLVEVKRLSHKLLMKDFEQLTLYLNSDDSVNIGILTNGIDYWIADNKKDGLENKKVYNFNLFEINECDLEILNIFFSYDAYHNLSELNRYIDYIHTGIDFGDKECQKILDLKNSQNDKKVESTQKKEEAKKEIVQEVETKKEEVVLKQEENFIKKTPIEEKPKIEEIKETQEVSKETQNSEVSVIEVTDDEKENPVYFELVDRNRVKIFLLNKYHILEEDNFSAVFLKAIQYIFDEVSTFPALLNKIFANFDFIVDANNRTVKSAKYETVVNGYYIDTNINSYTKIVTIEEILKFINKNKF